LLKGGDKNEKRDGDAKQNLVRELRGSPAATPQVDKRGL